MVGGTPVRVLTKRCMSFLVVLISGCVFVTPDDVAGLDPVGPPLNAALYPAYLELSREKLRAGDRVTSSLFAYKSRSAARGELVSPEALEDRSIPTEHFLELEIVRARLLIAIADSQRVKEPELVARAQTRFDCWVEAREKAAFPQDIARCRSEFYAALNQLRGKFDE